MTVKTFIPKDNQALPDTYTVKILLATGKERVLEVAEHRLIEVVVLKETRDSTGNLIDQVLAPHATPFFEFWTKDDIMVDIILSNIVSIEFDKNWSKIVEISRKKKDK